jgi:cysteine desulfurase
MPGPASSPPRTIYLDHAAATPLRDEVAAAMDEARRTAFANPSSPHAAGRTAKRLLEESRERIVACLGGRLTGPARDRFVFTSGATEANRLAILGRAGGPPGWCGHSPRDHGSVVAAAAALAAAGWRVERLTLGPDGGLTGPSPAAPWPAPELLCVTSACGQTGTVECMARIWEWAVAAPGRIVHVDATQAVACGPAAALALPAAGIEATLVVAPAKFGGPRGIGGLLARGTMPLDPVVPGPQETGLRGGTEAVALAVGFARALELATTERAALAARLEELRDRLEPLVTAAAAAAGCTAVVVGRSAGRVPHVTTIAFPGLDREAIVMAADLEGVCLATGTACASGSSEPAPAVAALDLTGGLARAAVRFSLGRDTDATAVDAAVARLAGVLARMVRQAGAGSPALHLTDRDG